MSFFESIRNLDFGKIGNVIGKVAGQAGKFASAYNDSNGSGLGKVFSGLGGLDLRQVVGAVEGVRQQIDNVRQVAKKVDVPPQAMAAYKNQGFVEPVYMRRTQKQSTGSALNAIKSAADILASQTQMSMTDVASLEREIFDIQQQIQDLIQLQEEYGYGRVTRESAMLTNELQMLNKQLQAVTNRLVQDSNTHEKALNGIKNSINSVTNSPSLLGGTFLYETKPQMEPFRQQFSRKYLDNFEEQVRQTPRNYRMALNLETIPPQDYRNKTNTRNYVQYDEDQAYGNVNRVYQQQQEYYVPKQRKNIRKYATKRREYQNINDRYGGTF